MPVLLPNYLIVILVTLAVIVGAGLIVARNLTGRTVGEYFFAGGQVHWGLTGTALFVTMLWGATLLLEATPSAISRSDAMIPFLALAAGVTLLGFLYGPSLKLSGSRSLPSYLTLRYGRSVGLIVALAWVCFAIVVTIPFTILVGTRLLHFSLRWDVMQSGLLLVVLSGILVVTRGYVAVLITHTVAGFFAIVSIVSGAMFGLPQWLEGTLWNASIDPLPTSAVITGSVILGLWFSCADQLSTHHMIAARDCGSVRYGSLVAAAGLVIVSLMAAYVTLDGTVSDFPADQGAVTVLIGTTVLVTAIAFLSSQFMSIATLVGINVYQAYRPEKDEGSIVLVGRTAGTVVVFAAILAGATVGVAGIQRVDWLVRALAAGVPPVAAIVLIGALWNRMHGRGALWALLTGWGVGVVQSVLIAESVASVVIGMIATFVVSALVLVAVSTVVSGEGVLQKIPETLVTKGLQSRKS